MITEDDIKSARLEVTRAKDRLERLERGRALQECPLHIGQTIEICGHSHAGKEMIVRGIGPARSSFWGCWQVVGSIIKKNGKPGEITATVTQNDWELRHG